jgi:arachidonate 15-lipoxygenase
MSAFIPQLDPQPVARSARLTAARRLYQYNHTYVSPLAVLERVPLQDDFSLAWLKLVGERVLIVLENQFELEFDGIIAEFLRAKHSLLTNVLAAEAALFVSVLRNIVSEAMQFSGRASATAMRATDLENYARMFRKIGLPPIAQGTDDHTFAAMRLAGPNPVMLARVVSLDDRFPVTEALYQSVRPGDSLAAACAEGRLFLADYAILDGAQMGTFPHDLPKYVYAPLALFVVDRTTKELLPVAIQCKQTPGPDNPIFTPDDGPGWLIAKTVVSIADGNVHEAVTHLARTHLLIEPFVIATYRQLAPNHPLFRLLWPHFEGTLAINDASWRHLIANKGAVEKLMAGNIAASRRLTVSGVQLCLFNESMLPRALAQRGVSDTDWLATYPYRDDALLYWSAIHRWVQDYLTLYYPSDAEVAADPELKAWLAEIGAQDGGRINGFGTTGSPTLAYLVEAVTMIIYTASVQHAAVNFPQYDLMSYVPHMPLAGYTAAPTTKTGLTVADHLAMLPPLDMAELQMELGYLLGTVHYTTLGRYPSGYFDDPAVAEPLQRFQADLADIGRQIDLRNQTRRPYQFLIPSGVPQSINI